MNVSEAQRFHGKLPWWFAPICIVMVLGSAFAYRTTPGIAVAGLLLFGLGGIFAAFVNSRKNIVLDADGFTVRSLARTQRYDWAGVTPFTVWNERSSKALVVFDTVPPAQSGVTMMRRTLTGFGDALPDRLNVPARDVAAALNAAREAAISAA